MSARSQFIAGICCLLLAQGVAWFSWPRRPAPIDGVQQQAQLDEVLVDLEPGEFAGTLLLGGMRGLVIDLLWLRALNAKDHGRYYESVAVFQVIGKVQPRFEQVWEFMAHDMAYNLAHYHDGRDEKWSWYLAGIDAIDDGVKRNPRSHRLLRYMAWMTFHKGQKFAAETERHDWSLILGPLMARFPEQMPPYGVGQLEGIEDGRARIRFEFGDASATERFVVLRRGEAVAWALPDDQTLSARGSGDEPVEVSVRLQPLTPGDEELLQGDDLVAVSSWSSFAIAERIYRCAWHMADVDYKKKSHFIIRLAAVAASRDGDRLRNLGRHRDALDRYLEALQVWDEALAWTLGPDGPDRFGVTLAVESYQRNAGRLTERASWLARQLAEDEAQGAALAEAITAHDFQRCQELLSQGAWRTHLADQSGIVWYDE